MRYQPTFGLAHLSDILLGTSKVGCGSISSVTWPPRPNGWYRCNPDTLMDPGEGPQSTEGV